MCVCVHVSVSAMLSEFVVQMTGSHDYSLLLISDQEACIPQVGSDSAAAVDMLLSFGLDL